MLVYHPHILLDAVDHVHTGQTALHKIAQKLHDANSVDEKARYVQCLHILVSSSPSRDPGGTPFINVNAQDAFGNTALHYAALSGNKGIHFVKLTSLYQVMLYHPIAFPNTNKVILIAFATAFH